MHNLVTPSTWLSKNKKKSEQDSFVAGQPLARTEHWKSPVPGVYRHKPGVGWFLIQLDSNPSEPEQPDRVIYCEPLRRGMLETEYKRRTMKAKLPKDCTPAASRSGSPSRKPKASAPNSRRGSREEQAQPEVNFVRHDDGVSWLNDKDAAGKPTKGPWQRFCLDKKTGEMRVMLKIDDPSYKKGAESASRPASTISGDNKSVASSIKAIAPELGGQPQNNPAFLGPRSIAGSSRSSPRSSQDVSRPASIRLPSHQSARKSPLSSPGLPVGK